MREQPEFSEKLLFLRLDSKMQGRIDAGQIRDFLKSRGSDCDMQQALTFMQYYDRDGDSALSIEELIRALTPEAEKIE